MTLKKHKRKIVIVFVFFLILCAFLGGVWSKKTEARADTVDNGIATISSNSQGINVLSNNEKIEENEGGYTNVKYISNENYFLVNPKHYENNDEDNIAGVCTTVAMQMLMGYHNYYSDP